MDCQFCTEFSSTAEGGGRIITEIDGWLLLPTIGCFTPGYSLLMPRHHIDAVADATSPEVTKLQKSVEDIRAVITSEFGPTIVAEHGPRGCQLGASCCSHAHLHFIPVPDPHAVNCAYQATGGPGRAISGLHDLVLVDHVPYVYLSPWPGTHLFWPADGFARQYVRRVCASLLGIGQHFDWRDHAFADNQDLTFRTLRELINPRLPDASANASYAIDGPASGG